MIRNFKAILISSIALMLLGAIILIITLGSLVLAPLLLLYAAFKIVKFIMDIKELDDKLNEKNKE